MTTQEQKDIEWREAEARRLEEEAKRHEFLANNEAVGFRNSHWRDPKPGEDPAVERHRKAAEEARTRAQEYRRTTDRIRFRR